MGQEISQPNKCNILKRQQQSLPQQTHKNYTNCNEKYTRPKSIPIYSSSSISTSSSTDDEHYNQRQKYNLTKQTYEKSKIVKPTSAININTTNRSSAVLSQSSSCESHCHYEKPDHKRQNGYKQRQRKSSQANPSGLYYSDCQCSSSASSASSICSQSVISQQSNKSLVKQKNYLDHHLYIKSYLDILEEDEIARAHFKTARPGGIRNYTPKILTEDDTLSTSAPTLNSLVINKQRHNYNNKQQENWI